MMNGVIFKNFKCTSRNTTSFICRFMIYFSRIIHAKHYTRTCNMYDDALLYLYQEVIGTQ